ncbi:hypothetical protein HDU76_010669 [Blyttiomyces sp. JEL0837]|nr:hypothetical protein HDU76_010669 [Blyttiomyces sp. JEL0837]
MQPLDPKAWKALKHCINIKGLFSENRFFYKSKDDMDWEDIILTHLDLSRWAMNFSPLHSPLQSSPTTDNYLPLILKNADLFRNVRVLYLHTASVKDPTFDYTSLRNFINVKSVLIESEILPARGFQSVPVNMITNLPQSVKNHYVRICEAALMQFCDMNPACDRLQTDLNELEIRIFEQRPTYPDITYLSDQFVELSRLFPTTVHLLRIFTNRDYVFTYKESSDQNRGVNVETTFSNFQQIFDSAVWSTYDDFGNLSDLGDSFYHNLVDVKFPTTPFRYSLDSILTMSPSSLYQRLESLSVCGNSSWFELEASKVLRNLVNLSHLSLEFQYIGDDPIPSLVKSIRDGCPKLYQVFIHVAESFTSFHLILQILQIVEGFWVAGGDVEPNAEWIMVAEAHGIAVEPFKDPLEGIAYPKSIRDLI